MDGIGELRHRIEVYSISTSIDSDYGGETALSEVLLATLWAAWMPKVVASGEEIQAGQKDDSLIVNWGVRYRGDIKSNMLVKYEGLYYNILSVLPDTKRCYMVIESEQVGENWQKSE